MSNERLAAGGRSPRSVAAVLAATLTIGLGTAAIVLLLIPARAGIQGTGLSPAVAMTAAFILVTPVLGAVLAIRQPGNRIGWLFIAVTFFFVIGFLGDGVAQHAAPTPSVAWFSVITNALGYFAFALLFVIFQVFPTGQVLPGWGWLPAGVMAGSATQAIAGLVGPLTLVPPIPDLSNPLEQPGWQPALDVIALVSGLLLVAVAVGTIVALAIRFRHATGIERQQIKWFAWAGMLTAGLLAASLLSSPWGPASDALWSLALASLVLLPVATTAAILRYRLWDIDRIISRTLSYAIVSGLLATVFAALVLGLQQLLASVTGASTISIAASTLAVFTLFQPARRRVQHMVDRRFDRGHYDAELALARLADRLRSESSFDLVGLEVETAVRRALAPSRVAVWTRR